jgi:hypothetical protein
MSRQPEARTGRDGIPVRAERRAKLDKVFEPLLDGVQQLADTIDALADTARNQKHPVEDDSVPVRVTMAMRLESLRKDREAAREV